MRRNVKNSTVVEMAMMAVALSFTQGCGSSSSSTGVSLTTISSLPAATSAVGTSSSALLDHDSSSQYLATSGLKLSAFNSQSWSTGSSRAMCEMGKIIRDALREGGEADKTACYIGAAQKNGVLKGIVDGSYNYFSLPGAGGGGSGVTPKIKFKITKNGSNISNFEMFGCFNAGSQDQYVSKDLADSSKVKIVAVHSHSNSGNTFGGRTTVSGAIDSSAAWTSKAITTNTYGTMAGPSSWASSGTVTQYSDRFQVSANQIGTYVSGGSSDSFSNQMFAVVQGLNMTKLTTIAMGDGSASAAFNFTRTGTGAGTFNQAASTFSWNGDTLAGITASTGNYYSSVSTQTLPTVPTLATVQAAATYSTAETWDCTAPTGTSFTAADMTAPSAAVQADFAACDSKYGFGNDQNNYVDCHNAQ